VSGNERNSRRGFVGKHEGKRQTGRPGRRWGISEWLLKGHDGWTWVGFIWPGIG